MMFGRFAEAQAHLNEVTNLSYGDLKARMSVIFFSRASRNQCHTRRLVPSNQFTICLEFFFSGPDTNPINLETNLEVAPPKLNLKPSP